MSESRPTAISGSITASKSGPGPKPPPGVPTAEPKIDNRGGRGLVYVALVVAVASAGGVVFLVLRPQPGGQPPPAQAQVIIAAPEPTPLAPASPPEPTMVHVGITSATRAARVTLRAQTYLLPFDQDFKAGSEPEVVEVTAPGREGRRFWIVFDRPVTLAADLPQGRGVVQATKEQTVIALDGRPVGFEPPAQSGPSDKSDVGGKPRAHGHRSPGDRLTVAQGARPVDDGLASSNAEPRAVGAPDSHNSAAPSPTDKPEPPSASKPAAAAAAPARSRPAAQAATPAVAAAAPAPSKPAALADAPAASKPALQADAPAPFKPAVLPAALAPSKPAAQVAPAASKPAAPAVAPAPRPVTPKAGASSPAKTIAATTAPAAASGRLDRAKTEALVKSHMWDVRRCSRAGRIDDPQPNGRVTLRILVSVTGTVTSAKVESSSLRAGAGAVESCLVEAVRSWKFPAPVGGPAVALYPFDFH